MIRNSQDQAFHEQEDDHILKKTQQTTHNRVIRLIA